MALVTATITVDFTANYSGNHRVCWRVQGSGDPYDCTTVVNCVGGGTTCSAVFNADVNTTSCDGTVTFEGYVQATCQDILSTDGRLLWTVDYTPTPTCIRHELTCDYVEIGSITTTDPGVGYLIGDTVVLTPVGVDPNLSDGIVTITAVGDGAIDSLSVVFGTGVGYTAGDIITIDVTAGPGCGYTVPATITIDTVGGGGEVTGYTLTTNGSGYTCNSFVFTGGTGTGFSVSLAEGVHYNLLGSILGFTISDAGSYDFVPAISITTGTGSGFVGTVVLDDCPAWNAIGTDCVGASVVNLASGLPLGLTWATCLLAAPAGAPYNYSVNTTGCCIAEDSTTDVCFDYHIENTTGGSQVVQYTACGGNDTVTVSIPDSASVAVCAVLDGVVDLNVPNLIITNSGTACI